MDSAWFTRKEAVKFVLIRSFGNFLVLFSLYGVLMTFGPAMLAELQFRIGEARGIEYTVSDFHHCERPEGARQSQDGDCFVADAPRNDEDVTGFAEVLTGDKEKDLIPKDTNFSIMIPKIGASAKVIPNVDPTNETEFLSVLQEGVAHAKGTVFPGMQGTTYLFAHSTDTWWHVGRYNAVFYLLKDLSVGDEIIILFEGERYTYHVSEKRILDASDVSLLSNAQEEKEQLVLQTCWPPGTTWKRLFIVAIPT